MVQANGQFPHVPSVPKTDDLHAGPTVQIRDSQVVVRTRSLLETGLEPAPDELVRDLLDEQWIPTEACPRPKIIVIDEAIQGDLAKGEWITVQVGEIPFNWEGHRHEHFNVATPVKLEFYVSGKGNRSRLWAMQSEARRIIVKWILAFVPYHSLNWDSFAPRYAGTGRYEGEASISLIQQGLPAFRGYVGGQEYPAVAPLLEPRKVTP